MTFKEALAFESETVFLNPEEFGEEIELDGVKMTAVVSPLVTYSEGELEGTLSGRTVTLYLAEKDFPEGIAPGREITVNKERWAVVGFSLQFGMVKLELSRRGWGW